MTDLRLRYARLYAGLVYDAMRFDVRHKRAFVVDANIKPAWRLPPGRVVFGHAFTCKGERVLEETHIDDRVRIEMFRDMTRGCVQVIDTGGDESVAHFGDISGKIAHKFGAVGAVIDGLTRDVRILEEDRFPVFCKGVQPIDAFGRWQIIAYQTRVQLAGITTSSVRSSRTSSESWWRAAAADGSPAKAASTSRRASTRHTSA